MAGRIRKRKVKRYIEGLDEVPAHGSRDMPMWGDLFRSLSRDTAQIRIQALSDLSRGCRSSSIVACTMTVRGVAHHSSRSPCARGCARFSSLARRGLLASAAAWRSNSRGDARPASAPTHLQTSGGPEALPARRM